MITSEKTHRVIAAGEAKAKEIGQPKNIAVVDSGTNLKAFTPHGRRLAWQHRHRDQQGLHRQGINTSNHNRVMIFAGAMPLTVDGKIVGAVGVSGGSGDQDQAVAEVAAAACK